MIIFFSLISNNFFLPKISNIKTFILLDLSVLTDPSINSFSVPSISTFNISMLVILFFLTKKSKVKVRIFFFKKLIFLLYKNLSNKFLEFTHFLSSETKFEIEVPADSNKLFR